MLWAIRLILNFSHITQKEGNNLEKIIITGNCRIIEETPRLSTYKEPIVKIWKLGNILCPKEVKYIPA